jgi:hypothetical protein
MFRQKKIYVEGKFVGEVQIPESADEDEEIALTRAFLQQKGLHKEISTLQMMFRQAVAFATTAADIHKRDFTSTPARTGLTIAPFVVNAAFAVELYLKTIGVVRDQALRGHDLLTLFDALGADAKASIGDHFSKCKHQCGIDSIEGFRVALDELRNAFVEWRYLYEQPERRLKITFAPLIFVLEVLHETCRSYMTIDQNASADLGQRSG